MFINATALRAPPAVTRLTVHRRLQVLILAVPTFYYLALFKNVFETCLNIKISLDTISPKQMHEEKHPLTSSD